jgi:aspartate/methionine/tyrosine aminotransferase
VDGPTKEEYVWGFRTGMLTFSALARTSDDALYRAMERKIAGAIRSAISNVSMPSQSILAKAMADPDFPAECAEKRGILETRARKVQEILANPAFDELWEPYPFNAGYFMCLRLKGIDAEKYRKHLLERYGVGVIADGKTDIRVAFSSVELEQLPELYATLADAARDLKAEEA